MAGAIDKKKNELIGELEGAPAMHRDARASILSDIALSREFAATFLSAVCQEHTGGQNEAGTAIGMSLATVCEALAKQRVICYGASGIAIRKFDFPPVDIGPTYGDQAGTVNGALALTEPTTSTMGMKATDIGETYTVNLSTTPGTQTEGSNTFSVYVGDYYLVRSRVSGELVDVSVNVTPYTTPDLDTVVGNVISWGSSVASEEEAETWNYNWAKANIASVGLQGEGSFNELNTLTLTNALTKGGLAGGPERSDGVTPLGPSFGNKFYLKRHADYVNTFTITGTTTVNTVEITGISETDIAKVKYGDVISGTGIPSGTITIAAVQPAKSQLRLSETAIADGTVTLTIDSVPFGYQAHDIFCQIEIVAEGLVTNDDWKPIGDDDGLYNAVNEGADDTLVASTSQFIGLLGFFNPGNVSGANENDLTKGASAAYTSDGKEYGTSYPGIEDNPFKPSTGGTTKAFEEKTTDGKTTIIGTQPKVGGLGDKDIWSGRYIRFDFERAGGDPVTPLPEFRYVTDSAERFYYAPKATLGYNVGTATPTHPINNADTIAVHTMPSFTEPRAELPRTGLSKCITRITKQEVLAAVGGGSGSSNTSTSIVPVDDLIHADGSGGANTANSPDTQTSNYYRLNNGIIEKKSWVTTYSDAANGTHYTATNQAGTTVDFTCLSNYVARKLTSDGAAANTDVAFIEGVIDDLQSGVAGAGGAKFRDPVMESIAQKHVTSASANDLNFDSYICATGSSTNEFDGALSTIKGSLSDFYTTTKLETRISRLESGTVYVGESADFANVAASPSVVTTVFGQNGHAKWMTFSTACDTLETNLTNRALEIDARIGRPTYLGNPVTAAGTPPAVYVNTIPGSPASGEFVPYGRALYNNVNMLLGQDVDLLGGIIKDIESLTDLLDLVKNARNKYEIFSGRDKEY